EKISAEHLLAGFEIVTSIVIRTLLTQAVAAVAMNEVPHNGQRLKTQIAAAAVARLLGPEADFVELQNRAVFREQHAHALLCHAQPAQADIVGTALDQDRAKGLRHHLLKKGNVLMDELLLQADRVGGNNDPALFVGAGG